MCIQHLIKLTDKFHCQLTCYDKKHMWRNHFISYMFSVLQILLCQELFYQWTIHTSRVEYLLWLAQVSSGYSSTAFWWIYLFTGWPKCGIIFVVMFIVILWCTSFFRFAMRDFRKGNGLRYRQNFSVVEPLNKDISIKNIKQNFLLKTS